MGKGTGLGAGGSRVQISTSLLWASELGRALGSGPQFPHLWTGRSMSATRLRVVQWLVMTVRNKRGPSAPGPHKAGPEGRKASTFKA